MTLRILIALPLALAIGSCASNPTGYIGFGTRTEPNQAAADAFIDQVPEGTSRYHKVPRRDPKSPDIRRPANDRKIDINRQAPRPPNPPASASRPEPPRTAGKAQAAPTAKPAKPCKAREHKWQVWRPKVCP